MRNIVGERVLGLPKDAGIDSDSPFRDLKVGTQTGLTDGSAPQRAVRSSTQRLDVAAASIAAAEHVGELVGRAREDRRAERRQARRVEVVVHRGAVVAERQQARAR